MQWSERRQRLQSPDNLRVDQHWLRERGTAMDNPMADAGKLGLTANVDGAVVVNRLNRALVIIAGDRPLGEVARLRVHYREPRCCPYSLDFAMSRVRAIGRPRSRTPRI